MKQAERVCAKGRLLFRDFDTRHHSLWPDSSQFKPCHSQEWKNQPPTIHSRIIAHKTSTTDMWNSSSGPKKTRLLTDKQRAERASALPSSCDSLTQEAAHGCESGRHQRAPQKQLLCQYLEDKLVTDCFKVAVKRERSHQSALFLFGGDESNKNYNDQLRVCA